MIACILALALCACGEKGATEPGTGVYVAQTASMMGFEMGVDEVFEQGFKLDLRDKGTGRIYVDGDDAGFKWTLDGTAFSGEGGGAELSGTMKDGVIELTNVMDTGIDMKLVCDNPTGGEGSSSAPATLLGRLKAVKNGEQVYGPAGSSSETGEGSVAGENLEAGENLGAGGDSDADTPADGDDTMAAEGESADEYGSSFAGDWEGMTFVYDSEGTTQTEKMGKTAISADSVYGTYARIWFDEYGDVKMDMVGVIDLPEMNLSVNSASYDEAADTLAIDGKLCGGEFSAIASSPDSSNGVLTFSGRTNGDIQSNYVVYLKRLDSNWDRSDAPLVPDKEYNIYIINNRPNLEGKTLEERVKVYSDLGVEVDMSDFLEPAP